MADNFLDECNLDPDLVAVDHAVRSLFAATKEFGLEETCVIHAMLKIREGMTIPDACWDAVCEWVK